MARLAPAKISHPRLAGATLIVGLAMVTFVSYDGSLGWRLGRVTIVAALTAVVVVWISSAGDRSAGRLAVCAGATAVVAGAGFVPFAVKGGSTLLAVAAVVATVVGVVLFATGVVLTSRGRRTLRRLATGTGALVALVVTALTLSPAIMATNVPRPELGATPTSRDLTFESVHVRTGDGVLLAAWYIPSDSRAAVVLRHGAGSTRSNVLDQAAVLAHNGFGVLMVDARGHGESGGRAMDFGWFGDEDVDAAVTYLVGRPDVDRDRIGAVGLSMGGEEVIGAAPSDPRLRAVVAEGATARVAADEAWLSEEHGWRGAAQEQLERVQDAFTDLLTRASPPSSLRDAVRDASTTRFLLIAAGRVPEEVQTLQYLESAAPGRVTTWTVQDAGHTDGLSVAAAEWEERVISFLRRELLPRT